MQVVGAVACTCCARASRRCFGALVLGSEPTGSPMTNVGFVEFCSVRKRWGNERWSSLGAAVRDSEQILHRTINACFSGKKSCFFFRTQKSSCSGVTAIKGACRKTAPAIEACSQDRLVIPKSHHTTRTEIFYQPQQHSSRRGKVRQTIAKTPPFSASHSMICDNLCTSCRSAKSWLVAATLSPSPFCFWGCCRAVACDRSPATVGQQKTCGPERKRKGGTS